MALKQFKQGRNDWLKNYRVILMEFLLPNCCGCIQVMNNHFRGMGRLTLILNQGSEISDQHCWFNSWTHLLKNHCKQLTVHCLKNSCCLIFKRSEIFHSSVYPSSAPSPNPNLGAEVALFPDYPTTRHLAPGPRRGTRPSGIVFFLNFRAKLRKQKLLVYIRRPQNGFQTLPQSQK